MTTAMVTRNPLRDDRCWDAPSPLLADFHRRMPAYAPTLLVDAPDIAASLGFGRVLVKAETRRMGLPSFKILGASWATYQAICSHLGHDPEPWSNINELAANLANLRPFRLATATDGNHGRAVSFMARLLGFEARVFVPNGMSAARIEAMEREGAVVTVVDGDYDDAVRRSADEEGDNCLVISDTSWPGYETIPSQVIEGYSTIFVEIDEAIASSNLRAPDVVVVPVGVGAFMAAAVTHYRSRPGGPALVGVEPFDANCVQVSAMNGAISHVPGPHRSIMVGLNCGQPSLTAWPRLASGVDWFASVSDDAARGAMRELAGSGVVAGETGGASLAGLQAIVADDHSRLSLGDRAALTALVLVTEGATDPEAYERIVGRPAEQVGRVLTVAR